MMLGLNTRNVSDQYDEYLKNKNNKKYYLKGISEDLGKV